MPGGSPGHDDLPPQLYLRSPRPWTDPAVVADRPVDLELVGRLPAAEFPEGGRGGCCWVASGWRSSS